jgi:hypothetical protein
VETAISGFSEDEEDILIATGLQSSPVDIYIYISFGQRLTIRYRLETSTSGTHTTPANASGPREPANSKARTSCKAIGCGVVYPTCGPCAACCEIIVCSGMRMGMQPMGGAKKVVMREEGLPSGVADVMIYSVSYPIVHSKSLRP